VNRVAAILGIAMLAAAAGSGALALGQQQQQQQPLQPPQPPGTSQPNTAMAFVAQPPGSATRAPINAATPPTTKSPDCTNSGCHASELSAKFLHAPAATGACEVCHQYVDPARHTFELKHQGAAMCDFCHIGKTDSAGLHVHKPVQDGQCVSCHTPHGSENRNLLRGATTAATCLTCHESVIKDKPHVHPPIASGDCLGCHKAHSSVLPRLLVEQGRALCIRCHADVEKDPAHAGKASSTTASASPSPSASQPAPALPAVLSSSAVAPASAPAAAASLAALASVHDPFKRDCLQCHDQHASREDKLLKNNVPGLCTSCHSDIAQKTQNASVPHSPVLSDRACLNCHVPHVSGETRLLKAGGQMTLCLDCHNKPIVKPDGSKIESVATMMATGQHLHGALDNGSCAQCHDVHGGTHAALLVRNYTKSFYQQFDADAYALCFGCHKQELATERLTTTATNFRNGDVNLHYVHVTGPGEAGRSCRVCHATHSAANEKQIRQTTPYGQWDLPLTYAQTATGGSCGAGCHRARGYDRAAPVINEGVK